MKGTGNGAAGGYDIWLAELRFLMLLSAPAVLQLCTQQSLVVTNQVRFVLTASVDTCVLKPYMKHKSGP